MQLLLLLLLLLLPLLAAPNLELKHLVQLTRLVLLDCSPYRNFRDLPKLFRIISVKVRRRFRRCEVSCDCYLRESRLSP